MCSAPRIPPPPPAVTPPPVLEQAAPKTASSGRRQRRGLSAYKIQPQSKRGPSKTKSISGLGTKIGTGM